MYTVWVDNNYDGWSPSDLLPDLAAVLAYIAHDTYGHTFRVTRDVDVQLIEQSQ